MLRKAHSKQKVQAAAAGHPERSCSSCDLWLQQDCQGHLDIELLMTQARMAKYDGNKDGAEVAVRWRICVAHVCVNPILTEPQVAWCMRGATFSTFRQNHRDGVGVRRCESLE